MRIIPGHSQSGQCLDCQAGCKNFAGNVCGDISYWSIVKYADGNVGHYVPVSNSCLSIRGTFIIDQSVTFTNMDFRMEPGSEIVLQNSGVNVSLVGCTVHGCTQQWKSITVPDNASLTLTGGTIRDAEYAVQLQGAGILTLGNETFNNNGIGLYVPAPQYGGYQQPTLTNTGGNVFNGGSLLPCFSGEAFCQSVSYSGMSLNNCSINTGNNDPSSAIYNTFNNFSAAIVINNSGFSPNITGNFMNTNIVTGVVDFNGYYTNIARNIINATNTGIYSLHSLSSISQNTINAVSIGIDAQMNADSRISIFNGNNITVTAPSASTGLYGVRINLLQGSTQGVYIDNNTINFLGGENGIRINGANQPGNVTVSSNRLNGRDIGNITTMMDVNAVSGTNFSGNIFTMPFTTNGNGSGGLNLQGCDNSVLTSNTFNSSNPNNNGTPFDNYWPLGLGVEAYFSTNNQFCANNFNGTGNGIVFNGTSSVTSVKSSTFNHLIYYGLTLQNGTLGLKQDHFGNNWVNCAYAANGSNAGSPNLLSSQFIVKTLPSGVINSPVSTWFIGDGQNEAGCVPHFGGGAAVVRGPQNVATEYDLSVAQAPASADAATGCLQWLEQKMLMQRIADKPELLGNPVIAKFYARFSGTAMDQHNTTKKHIADLYAPDDATASALSALEKNIANQYNGVEALEMKIIRSVGADALSLKLQQKSIYDGISQNLTQLRKMQEEQRAKRSAAADQAIQENEQVNTAGKYELYEKEINRVYLYTIAKDIFTFTDQQKATIDKIAAECPYTSGMAVFLARSLQHTYKQIKYNDEGNCLVKKTKELAIAPVATALVKLFPNPATGILTLEFENALKSAATLQIYDLTGKAAAAFALPEGTSSYSPDISHLPEGIYSCKLLEGKTTVWKDKLVIIHK